jgi:fructose-1,6-bisphosphatase/inositol monophosphatase family enzyme
VSLIDRVSALLAQVVAEEVVGRYRTLQAAEILGKHSVEDPGDIVTVVDHAVEERLTPALLALLPGSLVVGEEAVHAQPHLLERMAGSGPVWVVDPIDGTRNFARGEDTFGVMIALVESGATRASWITLPARGQTFVAERGGGAYRDGQRIQIAAAPAGGLPRGTVYTYYMPPAVAAAAERALGGKYEAREGPGAAAIEYTALVQGEKELVVYYRLKPWDHAAGALLLTEAGGAVEHLDGAVYSPRSQTQVTILGARPSVCAAVRGWLQAG